MILDSSALLAYLLNEPGAETVLDAIDAGAAMSVVNFAEVASRYGRRGATAEVIAALRERLPFRLLPLEEKIAVEAGLMAREGAAFGLSLGDRCCLATARQAGVPALTADRIWTDAAKAFGVDIVLVR